MRLASTAPVTRVSFLLLALGLVLPDPALGRPRNKGVWVEKDGRLTRLSVREFEKRYRITWLRQQELCKGTTEQGLPGYSDGPGTLAWDFEKDEPRPEHVAPQYVPNAADLKAIRGKSAALYVGQVKGVGNGLFARKAIPKGAVLGEYTGVVRGEQQGDTANGYLFTYDPWNHFKMAVDAEQRGNYLRFANHSQAHANAEPRMVYDRDHRRWHVLLVATRAIQPREQVLFDYGHQYGWERFGIVPKDLTP